MLIEALVRRMRNLHNKTLYTCNAVQRKLRVLVYCLTCSIFAFLVPGSVKNYWKEETISLWLEARLVFSRIWPRQFYASNQSSLWAEAFSTSVASGDLFSSHWRRSA